jgi:ABC-type glycerol-3-phosphate transport system substrate-binding protein
MNRFSRIAVMVGASALGWAAAAGAATAQDRPTPKSWNYEPKDGNRVNNPDGSWREEVRQGNCVTVKEKSASGEYKETRRCD